MDEIEEFLRRAAQRRREQPAPPPQPEPPQRGFDVEPLYEPEVMEAEIVEPDPYESSVRDRHLPASNFAERTSHLAEEIEHTDERTESHLHDAFDHKVGALDDSDQALTGGIEHLEEFSYDEPGERYENKFAIELIQMFNDPKQIAKAFVLKEILDRRVW